MDAMKHESLCPVCGYQLDQPAWDPVSGPSDEICPSCGIQFGYDDAAGGDPIRRQQIYLDWRERWVKNGMKWHSTGPDGPPAEWNPAEQLQRVQDRS